MRRNNSGCLTGFVASFSRLFIMVAWIARPALFNATFSSIIIPCLGFLLFPFTLLMYLFLLQGTGGIQGLDWLWLILAVLMDVATLGSAGYSNRSYVMPGNAPGSQIPPAGPTQTL